MRFGFIVFSLLITNGIAIAQKPDTSKVIDLNEIQINTTTSKTTVDRLPEISGALIYSGKKNEVVKVSEMDADLSGNNQRQVFAKVPGVSIWENDASGIQIGIATRGLSPNRSWEFNVRQNGYDISSEVFGYPEAYFSPPMEALQSIQVVRGAASLQYGPQFGGLLNYVTKKGDAHKPISFETQQTTGSYGLFNSYNALGGTYKKFSYYTYLHHRNAMGWRENNKYSINTGYASISYSVTSKLNIELQYTRMNNESQQPGGLTDSMLKENPRRSYRSRNWLSTPWNVAALDMHYQFNPNTVLNVKFFGTLAERNSVGFTKGINVADTFNASFGSFNLRQVDRDAYQNVGCETRFLTNFDLFQIKNTISLGFRVYQGNTHRKQLGIGTGGDDFDLSIATLSNNKEWGRDLHFSTSNVVLFAEHLFRFGERLSFTPGARYEIIRSAANGFINTSSTGSIAPLSRERTVLLFGAGTEFKTSASSNIYANFSQSFRPVTYSELTPSAVTDIIDPNLRDAEGYNADLGLRGKIQEFLNFDVGAFYLHYDHRIGTITQNNLPFRTNIGTSVSKGVESYVELHPVRIFTDHSPLGNIHLFLSYAYVDARYTRWDNPSISNDPSKSIDNKRVENAPQNIGRYGATYQFRTFSATFQFSHVSEVFTDAANTEKPNNIATIGKIQGYEVMDLSFSLRLLKRYHIKGGINNLSDKTYATRRAGGYPGPGLLPANGRTFFVGIGVKF